MAPPDLLNEHVNAVLIFELQVLGCLEVAADAGEGKIAHGKRVLAQETHSDGLMRSPSGVMKRSVATSRCFFSA